MDNMIMKMQKIFSKMQADNDDIALLRALRPHIKNEKKVDDAIRIMQLLNALPALKESGLFGGGLF